MDNCVLLSTLGPAGTCSEYCANYFINKEKIHATIILSKTFEQTIDALVNGSIDMALIPSAYTKFADIVFNNLDRIKIYKSFLYNTPKLMIVKKEQEKPVKKIATHPSPSSLITNYYKGEVEVVYTKSNSESAILLENGQVDACITTEICATKYDFCVIKNFGNVAMSWNIFMRVGEDMFACVSEKKMTPKGDIQEIYNDGKSEVIINFISKNSQFKPHKHIEAQGVFGVLGEFELGIGEQSFLVKQGAGYYANSNVIHSALPVTDFISIDIKQNTVECAGPVIENEVTKYPDHTEIKVNLCNKQFMLCKYETDENLIHITEGQCIVCVEETKFIINNCLCTLSPLKIYRSESQYDAKVLFSEDADKLLVLF